jgi:O-antigen ligase
MTWAGKARLAGWVLSFAFVLFLAQAPLLNPALPILLKLLLAGVGIWAAFSPSTALLAVVGLVPLGHVLVVSVWHVYPFNLGEALVLVFVAGYLWAERRRMVSGAAPADPIAAPAWLFAVIVVASCAVQYEIVQLWHDYPIDYAKSFVRFMATDYLSLVPDPRTWVDGRGFVSTAALLLEGIVLFRIARRLVSRGPALSRRLTTVVAVAGALVALLSFTNVWAVATERGRAVTRLMRVRRWSSPAIPSLDGVGTYFVLVAFLALATSAGVPPLVPLVSGVIVLAGMALTQTRAAIIAGMMGVIAMLVWRAGLRYKWARPSRVLMAAALVAIPTALAVIVFNPLHVLASRLEIAVRMRVLFAQAGLHMFATAPVTGVGIGQYELHYWDFVPRDILRFSAKTSNAHNYFLWMGAELGLVGLLVFVWLLGAAIWRGWWRLRAAPDDRWLLGSLTGLVMFIITWSVGQPLGVPPIAYTFWIALGAVAGYADSFRDPQPRKRRPFVARLALALVAVFAIASIPARIATQRAEIDMSRIAYGFDNACWEKGNSCWARSQARFFLRSSDTVAALPVAATEAAAPMGAIVDVFVEGRFVERQVLADHESHTITLTAPSPSPPFWRVDLRVTPIDPQAGVPGDTRLLAVSPLRINGQQPQGSPPRAPRG